MTKEELKALGLNDKQISEVFKLNGVAVNNAKGDLATKETELETKDTEIKTLQRQLETANKEIESFKELDIEEIKQRAEDYKKNLTETVRNYQDHLPKYLPLVHPSPLNFRWLNNNPWFEAEVVPILKEIVSKCLTP